MIIPVLEKLFKDALASLHIDADKPLVFETPKNPDHGDLATNVAMQYAKSVGKNPRQLAEEIIAAVDNTSGSRFDCEIAGAGFINIRLEQSYWHKELASLLEAGRTYGQQETGRDKKVNVEYVSANPTGMLHLGHGRNAAIGDSIANLYSWLGYDVDREYYFNNAGNQMNNLAKSIFARYKQELGETDFPFPEDGYHGEYIRTIAGNIVKTYGKEFEEGTYQDLTQVRKIGEAWCFEKIKNTMTRMNINHDIYFNEDSLYKEGKISALIDTFREKGLAYDKDGAVWLKLSEMGMDEDRVIVKSSGEPTYRLPDIAYHLQKLKKDYEFIVDVFGSDHIATVPDVLASVAALGFDKDRVKVVIHQFVTLTENGEQVKMSKRTGKSYTLDDLLDEVGDEVVRFFLLMRGTGTHLEFDLALAKEQSDKNPVFYLQYAHARICSITDNIGSKEITLEENPDLSLLIHPAELTLIKGLLDFPKFIRIAAEKFEPHILADYLRETAAQFHTFYHDCRIIGSEPDLLSARYSLAMAAKVVLKNGLAILGISAPERM